MLDTGTTMNFIESALVDKENIKRDSILPVKAITADDRELTVNEEATVNFSINDDNRIKYKTKMRIIKKTSFDLILGMPFFVENEVNINFREGLISIDGHSYELPITPLKDVNIENGLVSKSRIYNITEQSARKTFQNTLKALQHETKELRTIETTKHKIELISSVPTRAKPIPVPISFLKQTEDEIEKLLRLNVIRRSDSPFAVAAFPIFKKNGSVRLVVDYRALNKNTVAMNFPIPKIQEYLAQLGALKCSPRST